jgi:hypothetical protein
MSLIDYTLGCQKYIEFSKTHGHCFEKFGRYRLFCFVDDAIFSKTARKHAQRLENVLQRFDKANLQLHPENCVIAQPRVNYLGYVLSEKGVSAHLIK